jgi:AraC-like DNA-binding protein
VSPLNYATRRSLESARAELLGGKHSIGEIAWLAGYQHTSNFCSAFKRSFGVTPRQFQAAHAQQRRG